MLNLVSEQLLNGLIIGSAYALLGLGLALVYGVLGIVNFAHGDFYTWGAYMAFIAVNRLHVGYPVALVLVLVCGLIMGVVTNRLVFAPLGRQNKIVTLIASVGLSLFLSNAAILLFGPAPLFLRLSFAETVIHLGSFAVSAQRLCASGIAAVLLLLIWFGLKKAAVGRAIRAVAEDECTASLMGIHPAVVKELTFATAASLAALAGALFAPLFVITPQSGSTLGLKAFAVVIVGGFGNLWGAVAAAFLLGITESFATGFISSAYSEVIAFAVMILALILRPSGIVREGGTSY